MNPRHICIFPDRLDNGGIGRYAINLAEALLDQGARVDLFVTAPSGELFPQKPQAARLFVGGGSTKKKCLGFISIFALGTTRIAYYCSWLY